MAPYYDRKSPCRNTAKYGDLPSYTTVYVRPELSFGGFQIERLNHINETYLRLCMPSDNDCAHIWLHDTYTCLLIIGSHVLISVLSFQIHRYVDMQTVR
ncbi:unnamed protein product [Rotaria socialis]|uniref:Uncharacterized protein n=2 Tax=Rotaria socialis TaxID=392032 RepID=A0A818AXA7_9BILA|nr:unnamed protein product [Rotaria socialis]CAF4411259.1 unnamed protein product [Rotaria socialis]CAF4517121.1 unnamed protein product [Rotaria socialis]